MSRDPESLAWRRFVRSREREFAASFGSLIFEKTKRHDKHTTWAEFYGGGGGAAGGAGGEPRKLGNRRVSLPLFPDEAAR